MRKTWADLDKEREQLPKKLSRAAMCRRAGVSESTVTKGLRDSRSPQKEVRARIELVLEAARHMHEAGL